MNKATVFTASFVKKYGFCTHSNFNKTSKAAVSFNNLLKEIVEFKDTNISNWIIEAKIQKLCYEYQELPKESRNDLLKILAIDYAVDHQKICQLSKKLACNESCDQNWLFVREKSLKNALIPTYHWIFMLMSRLEHGVKFLVDLRTDILELISKTKNSSDITVLQQLNYELKDLLLLWFSVGFLHIERVTWQSSCEMLQKISDYEAVHPIKNWTDLKRRVGPYRRCYVFTHPSMPREPLVVLHTALCDIIPDSVKGIQQSENRILGEVEEPLSFLQEDKSKIQAAIFYSIASTQTGLQGIELGNYLIKKVIKLVTYEFPLIDQLSSLSPIPNFRMWLLEKIKQDCNIIFTEIEQEALKKVLQTENIFLSLKKMLNNNFWINNEDLTTILKEPMLRSCAWYLYREKRRNNALNNVANFHLRNGAVMWRINWMADPSPRGAANSCGIMVNYRYFLAENESNSRNYIEGKIIKASESVIGLANEAEKLMHYMEK